MKTVMSLFVFGVFALRAVSAHAIAQQIGAGDTALLFGGIDAEGGIGDWYVSNGNVQAIIDNVGKQTDLTPVVPGQEPPIQSEINPTGGTMIDLGLNGQNDDQLAQFFTVGGLSTSNFFIYDTISAPNANTIRASGFITFAPTSTAANPCLTAVTDYTADSGGGAFLTITTTATNNCGVALPTLGGFLDVFIWTIRGLVPFSGGGVPPTGGKGFNHPNLNLSNPALALEFPTFMAAPGILRPSDGIVDTINNTASDEVSYGLLGVEAQNDPDGPGGSPATVTAANGLFGVSGPLVTALGSVPDDNGVASGGTFTYVRRVYVGPKNDVRSTADTMITDLAPRIPFSTGTIFGDVDAADTPNVEATVLATRIGRCQGNASISCKTNGECTGGSGPCVDPSPIPNQAINSAMSQVRTDAFGGFAGVVLPQGDYELKVSSAERDDVTVRPVVVGAGSTQVIIPPLSGRGTVTFTVKEKSGGNPPLPAKLTFKGVTPTVDPRFHKDFSSLLGGQDILPETFGGTQSGGGDAAGQGNVVYTASGSGSIDVRPGTYDIYASRGMEYSVSVKRVTVTSGGNVSADFRLKRSVKTKNAISADFHVHSGRSLDTDAALRDRVKAFAGEGVEVMVSTDHDKFVDYAPLITSLGVGSRVRSIVGNEITGSVPNPPAFPQSIGHINAWPFVVQPNQSRDGAFEDEYVAPNWDFKRMRDAGAEVIQYNHPRAGLSGITSIGIFNNIGCNRCANDIDTTCNVDTDCPSTPSPQDCTCVGYQPDRPITMPPNDILIDDGVLGPGSPANPDGLNNFSFDVVEIENGTKDSDFTALRQMRRDWFSLLNQGIFRPGTGVSDSHRITVEHAGWARSYVLGVGDDPTALNVTTFDNNIKAGKMLIGGGPYIEFTARGSSGPAVGMGDLLSSPSGVVRLKIKVRSPAWIPVEEVRIIANGFVVKSYDTTTHPKVKATPTDFQSTGKTSRFNANVMMSITADTYFIVEAGPKIPASINTLPVPPPIVDIIEPDVVPMSITNPIFVDKNNNMTFDPPGLPVMMASRVQEIPPARGLWQRIWEGVTQLASRVTGEVVAQQAPGAMTGITKEQKAQAVEKGEYFPLYQFSIPRQAVQQAQDITKQAEKEQQVAPTPLPEDASGK